MILAAIEALADPAFNLDSIQATTHPVAPILIVNGPIARELGINSGYNAFGQGFQANLTIGRAVRLILMNVGGGLPGTGDRATQGSPAKIAYCVAENEEANPGSRSTWRPGFPLKTSTVTVNGCEGPHNIQDHYSYTGLGVLKVIAGAMGQAGSNNLLGAGHAAPVPRARARGHHRPRRVQQAAGEGVPVRARPLSAAAARRRVPSLPRGAPQGGQRDDTMVPIVKTPDDILVIVAGGAGKHSCWQPTFGDQTRPARRVISRRDGTPLAKVSDLRRSP